MNQRDPTPRASGELCSHPGCQSHVSHPCEGCGRIAARGEYPYVHDPEYEYKSVHGPFVDIDKETVDSWEYVDRWIQWQEPLSFFERLRGVQRPPIVNLRLRRKRSLTPQVKSSTLGS